MLGYTIDPAFMPLWQSAIGSLLGALGAVAVAMFTVWKTHKHTANREILKDGREKVAKRQGFLSSKLEELLQLAFEEYNQATDSAKLRPWQVATARLNRQPLPTTEDWYKHDRGATKAFMLGRLYFPTLEDGLRQLPSQLSAIRLRVSQAVAAAADDPPAYAPQNNAEFEAEIDQLTDTARRNWLAIVAEGSRLARSGFDLD